MILDDGNEVLELCRMSRGIQGLEEFYRDRGTLKFLLYLSFFGVVFEQHEIKIFQDFYIQCYSGQF